MVAVMISQPSSQLRFSRRTLLTGTGLGVAGLVLAGCEFDDPPEPDPSLQEVRGLLSSFVDANPQAPETAIFNKFLPQLEQEVVRVCGVDENGHSDEHCTQAAPPKPNSAPSVENVADRVRRGIRDVEDRHSAYLLGALFTDLSGHTTADVGLPKASELSRRFDARVVFDGLKATDVWGMATDRAAAAISASGIALSKDDGSRRTAMTQRATTLRHCRDHLRQIYECSGNPYVPAAGFSPVTKEPESPHEAWNFLNQATDALSTFLLGTVNDRDCSPVTRECLVQWAARLGQ